MKITAVHIIFMGIMFFLPLSLYSEVLYLHDGQIIKGAIIKENKSFLYVETEYEIKRIAKGTIKRILYGDRDLEKAYFQLKDRSVIKGYIIDQDNEKIIYREKPESVEEKELLKSNVKQISRVPVYPVFVDLGFRVGVYVFFNARNSRFKPSPIYLGYIGINIPPLQNLRLDFESGYMKSMSAQYRTQYYQVIPVTASVSYEVSISFFSFIPRIGFGIAVIDFYDGEGELFRGIDVDVLAGVGFQFEILKKHLFLSLRCEYNLLAEMDAQFHNGIFTGGLSYRF